MTKRSWLDSWLCLLNYFVINIYDAQISDDPRDNLSWLMTKRSWLYFWLRLAWTGLHDLPVCSFACMNYLSVCLHELQSVGSHSDSKRRCAFGCVPFRVVSLLTTHIYTPCFTACSTSRARNFIFFLFFLFFTSLPPGSWEGSVVESIHQLSYLG